MNGNDGSFLDQLSEVCCSIGLEPQGYQFGKPSEMILASFIEKWNDDVNLSFHQNDRNIYPFQLTKITILRK